MFQVTTTSGSAASLTIPLSAVAPGDRAPSKGLQHPLAGSNACHDWNTAFPAEPPGRGVSCHQDRIWPRNRDRNAMAARHCSAILWGSEASLESQATVLSGTNWTEKTIPFGKQADNIPSAARDAVSSNHYWSFEGLSEPRCDRACVTGAAVVSWTICVSDVGSILDNDL